MFIVGVMVFDIVVEARTIESKIKFDLMFVSNLNGIPSWSKISNSSKIEESGGNHPTWYM